MSKKRGSLFKKVFSIVVAGATALLLCVCPISANFKAENDVVSADESVAEYTFNGSSIWVPHTIKDSGGNWVFNADGSYMTLYSNFMFTIKKVSSSAVTLNVSGSSLIESKMTRYTGLATIDLTSNEQSVDLLMTEVSASDTYNFYINFYISSNDISSFVPNIYKLREWYDWNSSSYIGGNHIRYYDVNDNYLDISITCFFKPVGVFASSGHTPFGMTDRLYYFTNEISESQQYKSGYDAGHIAGYSEGEQYGYRNGNTIGYNQGYSVGYNAGLNEQDVYSFSNLIGSVVDVPVQTFMNLFNFELLGVNLASFFTGLLTLAFIICIVRLILP